MNRRLLIALGLGLSLVASSTMAQSAAAKAVVDTAKARGVVGEQGDGFLGLVTGTADANVKSAVAEINAGRAEAYKDIAVRTGVTEAAAGEATAQQLIAKLPSGYAYRPLGGGWIRK